MKKLLCIVLFSIQFSLLFVTVNTAVLIEQVNLENSKPNLMTFEMFYFRKLNKLIIMDHYASYLIDECKREGVNPIVAAAIWQIENPIHNPNARNKNYKKVWNKKTKKYHNELVSIDIGQFQLNSLCIPEFVDRYWTPHENEIFDPYNSYHNIRVAVRHIKTLQHYYKKDEMKPILAYNTGMGNVDRGTPHQRTVEEYYPLYRKYVGIMGK